MLRLENASRMKPDYTQQPAIQQFRKAVTAWYKRNARTFLWRVANPDPYIVLVSETMLQQTQTSRVTEKLPQFLALFPDVHALAQANNATILRAWQGMGYNSRALRLRDCAKAIVTEHNGTVPNTYQQLRTLPGIGDYTASAILSFAYHKQCVVLDVNIRRVYSRVMQPMPTTISTVADSELREFAERVFPPKQSSAWHQAIMDIGALYCTARSPKCAECPLRTLCASAHSIQEAVRVKKAEPQHKGIPNRIWRGKVVEYLRQTHTAVHSNDVLAHVHPLPITKKDEHWFNALLQTLVRDSMITINANHIGLKE